jgi:aminopeptidase N
VAEGRLRQPHGGQGGSRLAAGARRLERLPRTEDRGYSKAPAILRQLEFYLGEDAFAAGVQAFLRQHAHGAAEWGDLLAAFEAVSGESLQEWARAWVTGAGVPRVTLDWRLDAAGRVERLQVVQEQPFRPLRSQVLLVYADGTRIVHTVHLGAAPAVAVPAAVGRPAPLFAYANHGDYGYGLFFLDPESRRYALRHLGERPRSPLRPGSRSRCTSCPRSATTSPFPACWPGCRLRSAGT